MIGLPEPPATGDDTVHSETTDEKQYLASYAEYAKTLRTWFVAFGIGGPILMVTNASVAERFQKSTATPGIAKLFLVGVGLQVLLAMLNKAVMWACYHAERNVDVRHGRLFRASYWICMQFWIDFLIDVASMIVFAVATIGAFRLLVAGT